MHPILFELPGGFPIRSFGVMLALGFLLGSWILTRLVLRFSVDPEHDVEAYGAIPVWVLVGVVAGARLAYVVVEIAKGSPVGQSFTADPFSILFVWQGGLVMFGGMFGGMAAGAWCARKHRLPVAHAVDLGVTAAFFGQAVGRIGCLLVGDDYGARVPEAYRDLPFPITLRVPEALPDQSLFGAENAGELLWATQPWMSFNALAIGLFALFLLGRRHYPGQVALVVVVLYSITRFAIESFRGDSVRGTWFDGAISTSQLVSIVAGVLAALALVVLRARRVEFRPEKAPA